VKMIDAFLKKATKSKQICHFWFHPSMDPWYLAKVLPIILEKIQALVHNGEVDVMTMGNLSDYYKQLHHD